MKEIFYYLLVFFCLFHRTRIFYADIDAHFSHFDKVIVTMLRDLIMLYIDNNTELMY